MFRLANALGLGPASTPVRTIVSAHPMPNDVSVPRTFLVQACQQLWLVQNNDVYAAVHICCPYPVSPRPLPLVASSVSLPSRFDLRITRGYFSRQLHTGRLLLPHVPVGFVS